MRVNLCSVAICAMRARTFLSFGAWHRLHLYDWQKTAL
jgi:hypothetical protein